MESGAAKEIWVYADLRCERLFGFCLNVLAKARELARTVSGKAAVVLMGSSADSAQEVSPGPVAYMSAEAAAEQCINHGADTVYVLDDPDLMTPRADVYAPALADAVRRQQPLLVMFALTDFGRELAARTARISNAGLIAHCGDLRIEKEKVVATCASWGGEIMAEITFSNDLRTGFATVQPHILQAIAVRGEPGTTRWIQVDRIRQPKGLRLLSSSAEPEERQKLEEAEVVVVGGAGLENADGFGLVRELAAALGGEVGATRPPVLQHWVDEERLIGQTGKTLSPNLLFSIATSGAVQYTAGIMEAKTIVAINRDRHAPIFRVADMGIVADAKTFLPLLTMRVRQVVMRKLIDVLHEANGAIAKSSFGAKIGALREAHDWSREALAQATGRSPEFIAQVENNEVVPSVSFLLRLARALKVDPGTFLREEEKTMIRDQRAAAFIRRTQNYSYETLTPGAESQHLRAFMITIDPRQAHKPVAYKHEGEEFILVMEGELELTLGGRTYHLKPGESSHFNSEIPHKLKNLSDEPTRCVVVLYTP
jgi:electron transfer flavoprotein alpha subunit/transcriptional regulator with XRE-family HTH domain